MNYQRYITSDHWAARRDAYFRKHKRRCAGCDSTDEIHLHHKTYERMGAELDTDLVAVCQTCHGIIHDLHRVLGGRLDVCTDRVLKQLRRNRSTGRVRTSSKAGRQDPVNNALAIARGRRRMMNGRGGAGES